MENDGLGESFGPNETSRPIGGNVTMSAIISTDREALLAADEAHLIHPLHSRYEHRYTGPFIIAGGDGIYLFDTEGNRYIDSFSCLANVNIGHGRRELADAAARQMSVHAYSSNYVGFTHRPAIELAGRLADLAPAPLKATYFTCGGAEANDSAIKTARYFWLAQGKSEKLKIVSRRGAYHGLTATAMWTTNIPDFQQGFGPPLPGFIAVNPPYRYRCSHCADQAKCTLACADEVDQVIEREGPDTVAAVIAEPIQGAGGIYPPDPDYIPRLRQICDRNNVLLIADEIITGFGRTGKWFGVQNWDVGPDIMSFSKGITSGYLPLGGMMVSEEIFDLMNTAEQRWMHAYTYSGHPACCAVAQVNLDIMEQEDLPANAARQGKRLHQGLSKLASHRFVGDIRGGYGLMSAIELVEDKATKTGFPPGRRVGPQVAGAAARLGAIVRNRADSILLAPPLIITDEQVDTLVDTVGQAIEEATKGL